MAEATTPAATSQGGSGQSLGARFAASRWPAVVTLVVVLAGWELTGRFTDSLTSYPSAVVMAAINIIKSGELLPALLQTLKGMFVGFGISVAIGIPLGIVMGRSHFVDVVLDPYVTALYATPRIALVPLLILWVGIGFSLRITVTVLMAIFPIILNTYQGVRVTNLEHIEVARSFSASGFQVVRTVLIPNALPYVLAGLRLGIGRALIGITVAEMVVGQTGTGGLLVRYGRFLHIDRLFVPILMLGFLSILLQKILAAIEGAVVPWQKAEGS